MDIVGARAWMRERAWLPYVAPMAVFFLADGARRWIHVPYDAWYAGNAAVLAVTLVLCRRVWCDIHVEKRVLVPAALVGVAVLIEWIVVTRWVPGSHFGARVGFSPATIVEPVRRAAFIVVRLIGLAVLVPVMEELFWRAFLLRYFTSTKWRAVQHGAFSWPAFWIVAGAFAAAHPEWLSAVICAAAYALLLRRTHNVFACVVAHAVTNLGLGIYVLATGDVAFW